VYGEQSGPDGLEIKGRKEVGLKDVWLDKGSQTEKQNQESIYAKLEKITEDKLKWLNRDYKKRVDDALLNQPLNLPSLRILADYQGTEYRERLASARPDRTILSLLKPLVSSSKNITSSSTQDKIPHPATGTSHGVPMTLEHRPDRQYIVNRQYWLVYKEVGYALHDAQSIDKAFKTIHDVLTGDISIC